ncbi:MAG TPA: hypothetical protein VFX49_13875 [Chloroflexota bacterium]|nr:hypothetical protein [Chloroflexota bacterium]
MPNEKTPERRADDALRELEQRTADVLALTELQLRAQATSNPEESRRLEAQIEELKRRLDAQEKRLPEIGRDIIGDVRPEDLGRIKPAQQSESEK